MQGTPKKGARFGGSPNHQRLLMANLVMPRPRKL